MTTPLAITTRETAAFLGSHLPPGGSLVEVGCGDGDVALELGRRGFQVTAVDSDAEAVARARERGVDAVQASWPDFDAELADAVAFTRSLHHVADLRGAVARARAIADTVLVEDFAFDGVDQPTLAWFRRVVDDGIARGLVTPAQDELVARLVETDDLLAAWHQDHDHDLHTIAAMRAEIAEQFAVREDVRVPYLYRYLARVLPRTRVAAALLEGVFREETRLEERGEGRLIGVRVVGSVPAR